MLRNVSIIEKAEKISYKSMLSLTNLFLDPCGLQSFPKNYQKRKHKKAALSKTKSVLKCPILFMF